MCVLQSVTLKFHWVYKIHLLLGSDKKILIWDIAYGHLLAELTGHTDAIYSLSFSREGTVLASGMYILVSFLLITLKWILSVCNCLLFPANLRILLLPHYLVLLFIVCLKKISLSKSLSFKKKFLRF